MRGDEIREAGQLVGSALAEVSRGVHRIHGAIAKRVSGVVSAGVERVVPTAGGGAVVGLVAEVGGGPVRSLTYAAVDAGLAAAGWLGGEVLARRWGDDRPAGDSAGTALALVNGSHGHLLARRRSPLALGASVRQAGRDVALTPDEIRAAWPSATGELAVYVHGLVDTERRWLAAEEGGDDAGRRTSLPRLLGRELGLTPVLVRYNTGLPVVDNAVALGGLIERLVQVWDAEVTRIVLVGHSMGGLVCRAALAGAARDGSSRWAPLVTDLVTIGTPHEGAWLEQAVCRLGPTLRRVPEATWFGEQLDLRSDGIRDLGGPGRAAAGTLPASVTEHAVVGTVAPAASWTGHRVGNALGDLLVGVDSARGGLPPAAVTVVPGATHVGLVSDPRVGAWLASRLRHTPYA